MLKTIARTLPDAAAVTEQLVAQYGPEQLRQVEQLSKHFFRAWLKDGTVALAIIQWVMCRDIKKPRGPGETTGTIIRKDNRENI